MENKQLTFRRIRGRIVPIRVKKDPNLVKGAGFVGAGLGVAASAGIGAAQLVKKAAEFRIRAADLFFDSKPAPSLRRRAAELRGTSMAIRRWRKPVLGLGAAIAGSLIGVGASYISQSKKLKNLSDDQQATLSAVVGGAGILTSAIYYKNLGLGWKHAKKYAQYAVRGATHELPKITIPTKLGPFKFKK
jgi:hypothetical protein